MEIAIGIAAGVALGVLGFALGRSSGKTAGVEAGAAEADRRLRQTAEAVSRGRRPEAATDGSAEAELHEALERGWAPREQERMTALREALERVGGYLDRSVRAPLSGAGEGSSAQELRERIDRALGSLEDLDFFLNEPGEGTEGRDVGQLVQQVAREFASDQGVSVRLRLADAPVRADVNARALMDSLYLVLHNAGRFGEGGTVDLTVDTQDDRARVLVRDRGAGFSEEAFKRAFDPFYSTSSDGMGLGLPHARNVLEGMGGRIELRNVPDGGAEVEVSFPAL